MGHLINIEVQDVSRGSRAIVAKMKEGGDRIRLGTKITAADGDANRWQAELSAAGARVVGSALLLAAADIESRKSDGDDRGTAPGAGVAEGGGSGD